MDNSIEAHKYCYRGSGGRTFENCYIRGCFLPFQASILTHRFYINLNLLRTICTLYFLLLDYPFRVWHMPARVPARVPRPLWLVPSGPLLAHLKFPMAFRVLAQSLVILCLSA